MAKTYWHLAEHRRVPDDYDVTRSRLLYHPERGFEVDVPLADWYARHQTGSRLRSRDWERFADPARTTFARYTASRDERETYVDGLLRAIDEDRYHAALSSPWLETLERVLAPLRYPLHGLQMTAAYVASMAPSGRIAIAAAFQAADEMRRIQRVAYRMGQLRRRRPGFGDASREEWEEDAPWQPLRELVERLLVVRDWGESFVALDRVVKPLLDRLWLEAFADRARDSGDPLLALVLGSLAEDASWHRAWSTALLRIAIEDDAGSQEAVSDWIDGWTPRAELAARALAPLLGVDPALTSVLGAVAEDHAALGSPPSGTMSRGEGGNVRDESR